MSEPITVDLGDSWKPASLREAEARLNESLARSDELIKQVDEKLKQLPDVDHTAKPEDVTAIKTAAERPDAPAPLRELKKKVDAGELSWQDVLEGKALKDETVREVMTARLGEMREIYEEAEQGASLEEILEARGVTSGSVFGGGSSQTYSHTTPSAAPSEDDYFSGGVMSSKPATPPPPPPPPPPAEQAPPAPPAGVPARRQEPPPPPQRTPPPQRRREEYTEDEFENPLASRGQPKRPEPPAQSRRRRDRDEPDDDDYFGGPLLR